MFSIACIGFVVSLYFVSKWRKNSKRLKELKKYRILLENYNEFKNSPNLSKLIEFESLYREPINIFTIDKFSLNEIKIMHKVLNDKEY